MKLIISVDSVRFPLTGIGRYNYELARRLVVREDLCVRLFSGCRFLPSFPHVAQVPNEKYRLKRTLDNAFFMRLYGALMPVLRGRALRGNEDSIFHGANFFIPPFGGRSIATFHDISPFTVPQYHSPNRVRYWQEEMSKSLSRADILITVSEYSRREIINYFDWPADRIQSIPLAGSCDFRPRTASDVEATLSRYGLAHNGYCLFVGTIEPRKNILSLLAAYSKLPHSMRKRWPLILTGYKGWQNDEIFRRIYDAQSQGWARYLGFVPASDLASLFAGSRLFAFPSFYEGFGLPVLEAMKSGVPVVCSNSSSLPEVVGDVALVGDASDVDLLASNLLRGLEDEPWRSAAREAGLCRAANFSWDRCANEAASVYHRLASDG